MLYLSAAEERTLQGPTGGAEQGDGIPVLLKARERRGNCTLWQWSSQGGTVGPWPSSPVVGKTRGAKGVERTNTFHTVQRAGVHQPPIKMTKR